MTLCAAAYEKSTPLSQTGLTALDCSASLRYGSCVDKMFNNQDLVAVCEYARGWYPNMAGIKAAKEIA